MPIHEEEQRPGVAAQTIAVLGTGMMGPGIAVTVALAGHSVCLFGRTSASVRNGADAAQAIFEMLLREGVISMGQVAAAHEALGYSTNLAESVHAADLVIESVAEDLAIKQHLFAEIETHVAQETIIASNTSGLRMTDIAAAMQRPQRAVTTHFWNPPHLMPLVEIVKGEHTDEATVAAVRDLLTAAGKRTVVVRKDVPGQLGNRLLHAITREAFYLVQEGIASAEDVDTAIKYGPGLRFPVYGPLEHADLVGLDLVNAVESYLLAALCRDTEPGPLLHTLLARGDLGAKTGRGVYDWSTRDPAETRDTRDRFLVDRLKERMRAEQTPPGA